MKNNKSNGNSSGPNVLYSRLAAEKKKVVIALCLIAVMAFMWLRMLGKKTPNTATAAVGQAELSSDTSASDSPSKISFIELPNIAGRNDALTRDFFDAAGWQNFFGEEEGKNLKVVEEISVISEKGRGEITRKVAEKLKLGAIVLDANPQAFINDKSLSVGDKLVIRDGADTFECEVVQIEEKTVLIKCGEAEITLKLTQAM